MPMKIEGMQKAADCEDYEKEKELQKSGEKFFHVGVDARNEFGLSC